MNLRLAAGLTLTALAVWPLAASETAVDPAQRFNPWVIGFAAPEPDLRASVGVVSKYIEQGRVLSDNATGVFDVSGRLFGFGAQVTGGVALGSDSRGFYDTAAPDMPGLNLKLDFLAELEYLKNIPMLTINPYVEIVTAPVQPSENADGSTNKFKSRQRWMGADLWFAPPIQGFEGLEFGGGVAINTAPDAHDFRGAIGARQFYVHKSQLDFSSYQLVNFGNGSYREDIVGGKADHSGITTLAAGVDVHIALPYPEWYLSLGASVNWWASKSDRDAIGDSQETTMIVLKMGVEWLPGQ